MEPRDLNRVFDALAPTAEQEQAVLDRLLQTERKGRPMKKLKKLTVVGVAAALMVISCAAAVVTGLDQRLLDYFGASPKQAELLLPGAVPVDVTAEDNGATLHVTQVLMDRHSLLILAEFTAPEGTVLDTKGDEFLTFDESKFALLDGAGNPVSDSLHNWALTIRSLDDGDPLDNHLTILFDLGLTAGFDPNWDAAFLHLSAVNLGWFDADHLEWVCLCSGDWSFDVPLPQTDIGKTCELNLPVGELDGAEIAAKEIYLSPMTLRITIEREIPAKSENMTEEDEQIYSRWMSAININRVSLTGRDGRSIPLRGNGGTISDQENVEIYRLEEITDLSQLQGGVLTLNIGYGSVDIPLDGLAPVE